MIHNFKISTFPKTTQVRGICSVTYNKGWYHWQSTNNGFGPKNT